MDTKTLFQITRVKIYHGIVSFVVPLAIVFPLVKWFDAILIFITSFSILLATHVIDDINGYKNKTDILNAKQKIKIGEPKPLVSGKLTLYQAKYLAIGLLCIAFSSAMILVFTNSGSWITLTLGFFTVFWAYSYAGAPLKLSYHGLGESVLVVCAGIMPVNITYFIMTASFSAPVFFLGLGLGLLFASVLTASNMADVDGDLKTNRMTLSAMIYRKYGKFNVLVTHWGIAVIGLLLIEMSVLLLFGWIPLLIVMIVSFILLWWMMIEADNFNDSRRKTFKSYLVMIVLIVVISLVW